MRFLTLTSRNMKEIYRDPVSITLGVAMPAILLVLFVSIGKNAPVEVFTPNSLTPAVAVFSFGFLTLFSSMLLAKDRESAFLSRLLTAPLKPTDFILSYTLPFLPIALLQIAVCFTVGIIYGVTLNLSILLALFILFIISIACIGIGMIIGSLFSEKQAPGLASGVIIIISLFGGVWMNLKMVGGVFAAIGYALPFAYAIDTTRAVLNGYGLSSIAITLYLVIGYTLLFFILGVLCFRWRTKR
ncbi:MAG: ABC transporter permease [Methanobacterium sp. ERen5]|nr:MAG: ABC transporter permease [Methanobacterium sp. ERen5]